MFTFNNIRLDNNIIFISLLLILFFIFYQPHGNINININNQPYTHHPSYRTQFELYKDSPIYTFIGTPKNQNDIVLSDDNQPVNLGLSSKNATYGSVILDLEKDNYMDLFIAREDGVYYYKNNQSLNKPFSAKKIMNKHPGFTPYHITIHDFNHDGNPDLYIRQFLDSDPTQNGPPVILRFYQSYEFIDITHTIGPIQLNTDKQSDDLNDGGNFIQIKLPKTIDYAGARVAIIIGKIAYTKYNIISSNQDLWLTFNLGNHTFIDRIRIRTIYNKDKVFLEPKINSVLEIEPTIQFEDNRNRWRPTSTG